MATTRRTFLKLVAATSASALIPFRLIEDTTPLLAGEQWVAKVRETTAYDLYQDRWMARYDIRSSGENTTQWTVDVAFNDGDDISTYREPALKMLLDCMERDGIDPRNLITLPPIY